MYNIHPYVSLDTLIWKSKTEPDFQPLSEELKQAVIKVVGHRCRKETKDALYRRLSSLSTIKSCGIMNRLDFYPDGRVDYIPGQDYGSELKTLRACILE